MTGPAIPLLYAMVVAVAAAIGGGFIGARVVLDQLETARAILQRIAKIEKEAAEFQAKLDSEFMRKAHQPQGFDWLIVWAATTNAVANLFAILIVPFVKARRWLVYQLTVRSA